GPQQMMAQWLSDPEQGGAFLKRNPRGIDAKFVQEVISTMSNPMEKLGATERLVEIGTGPEGQRTSRELVPAAPKPSTTLVEGGSKDADLFGIRYLKPGERLAVDWVPGPDGRPVVVGMKDPLGGGITIDNRAESAGAAEQGKSLVDRNFKEVKNREQLYDAASTAQRLFKILGTSPVKAQSRFGILGTASQWGESIATQGRAIADQFGLASPDDTGRAYADIYKKYPLLREAAPTAQAKSNVTSLVFILAKIRAGQEGRDLSDSDVRRMYDMIGARAGSTAQLQAGVREVLGAGFKAARLRWQTGKSLYEGTKIQPLRDPYVDAEESGFGEFLPRDDDVVAPGRAVAPAAPGAAPSTADDIRRLTPEQLRAVNPDDLSNSEARAAYIEEAQKLLKKGR
ncbi:MAG: hypothetical protein L0170_18290, partial [Acidobacteria bacterium]|nr:hypothetical protein [Acidobacteriota bacterium]